MNSTNNLRKVITPANFITNDDLAKRAQQIAGDEGGLWSSKLQKAQLQLESELAQRRKAAAPAAIDDEEDLRKAATVSQLRHLPGQGDPDPDARREIGECETQLGRVRVVVERDSISIHGQSAMLSELDVDLRTAIVSTSAAFAAAIWDVEQTEQRAIVGCVVDAILRRHQFLTAKVKEAKTRERYDV
jgi:hypothetical protein